VFNRAPQVPTEALVGTTWILETILDGDVAATPIGDAATLLLDADGECSQDVVDQDGIVVTVLGDGFRPTIEGDLLTITSMGDQGLVYRSD
jgi:hypothetical protein